MALGKEEIMSTDDARVRVLQVAAWSSNGVPAEVFIRTISGVERDRIEEKASKKELKNFRAGLASMFLSDDSGKRLFGDADVPALGMKSAAALDCIMDAGLEFNHMDAGAEERLGKD